MARERQTLHRPQSRADQAADAVTRFVGRWAWVAAHAVIYGTWLQTNLLGVDPPPHGLLTMTVALEAVFLASFILIGQNRRAAIERGRDALEMAEARELDQVHAQQVALLERLGQDLVLLRSEHRALHAQVRRALGPWEEEE